MERSQCPIKISSYTTHTHYIPDCVPGTILGTFLAPCEWEAQNQELWAASLKSLDKSLPFPGQISKARSLRALTQGLQPAFRVQGFLFLLIYSEKRRKHLAHPRNREGSHPVVLAGGMLPSAHHPQSSHGTEKSRRSQTRPRWGPEPVLERCNSRREDEGPPVPQEVPPWPSPRASWRGSTLAPGSPRTQPSDLAQKGRLSPPRKGTPG